MNRALVLLLAVTSSGCVFVTRQVEVQTPIRDEGSHTRTDGPATIALEAVANKRSVQVRTMLRQNCVEEGVHVFDRMRERKLQLVDPFDGWNDTSGLRGLFYVAGLPVTLISLVASGIHAAGTREHDIVRAPFHVSVDCSQPAAETRIVVLLPSGRSLVTTSDSNGAATFTIPDDEGAIGDILVSLVDQNQAPIALRFGIDPDACVYEPTMHAWGCTGDRICRDHRCVSR